MQEGNSKYWISGWVLFRWFAYLALICGLVYAVIIGLNKFGDEYAAKQKVVVVLPPAITKTSQKGLVTVTLPPRTKLVNVVEWRGGNEPFYLTRPFREGERAETSTFQQAIESKDPEKRTRVYLIVESE